MFYHTYIVSTIEESDLLDMYCEGRSALWRMFFGWRKTKKITDSMSWYYYKVPKRIFELATKLAEHDLGISHPDCY